MILGSGNLRTHGIQAINSASQACHGQTEQLEQGKPDHLVLHKEKQITPSIKAAESASYPWVSEPVIYCLD